MLQQRGNTGLCSPATLQSSTFLAVSDDKHCDNKGWQNQYSQHQKRSQTSQCGFCSQATSIYIVACIQIKAKLEMDWPSLFKTQGHRTGRFH